LGVTTLNCRLQITNENCSNLVCCCRKALKGTANASGIKRRLSGVYLILANGRTEGLAFEKMVGATGFERFPEALFLLCFFSLLIPQVRAYFDFFVRYLYSGLQLLERLLQFFKPGFLFFGVALNAKHPIASRASVDDGS